MSHNINWASLKKECCYDLSNVIKLSLDVEGDIRKIMSYSSKPDTVFGLKSKLEILIKMINSMLHSEIKSKADEWLHFKLFHENYARMLRRVDEIEMKLTENSRASSRENIMPLLSAVESMLYGDIYFPLLDASRKSKHDRRAFLYHYFTLIALNVGIFGAESRFKSKSSGLSHGFDDVKLKR